MNLNVKLQMMRMVVDRLTLHQQKVNGRCFSKRASWVTGDPIDTHH